MSKLVKKEEVVLSKLQAAVMVDALMICYGTIIDQIPLDDLIEVVKEHRESVVNSFKVESDGK